MSRIGPGNNDRAWNDPPKMAFSVGGTTGSQGPGSRIRMMNKRVPVPLETNLASSGIPIQPGPSVSPSMPPMKGFAIGPPPCMKGTVTSQINTEEVTEQKLENSLSSVEMLKEVDEILHSSLKKFSNTMQNNVVNDVNKRLHNLCTMWEEEKLNDDVKNKMYTLCQAMMTDDFEKAWSLHRCLIVDYTSMCSQWMVGVKVLIAEGRSQKPQVDQCNQPITMNPLKDTSSEESNILDAVENSPS